MSTFDDFVGSVIRDSKQLTQDVFDDLEIQGEQDVIEFVEKIKPDLRRWTESLQKGRLTGRDFADLVHARKALAEMRHVDSEYETLIKIEKFRAGVTQLIVERAFEMFL